MKFAIKHLTYLSAYEVSIEGSKPIIVTEKLLKNLKPGKAIVVNV